MGSQIFNGSFFNITFLALCVSYLAFMGLGDYPLNHSYKAIHKALPVLCLLIWAWYALSGSERLRSMVIGALFFSALGDVFLALSITHSFVFGLSAFLTAHVFYIVSFWQLRKTSDDLHPREQEIGSSRSIVNSRKLLITTTLFYFVGMLLVVLPKTGNLMAPVIVYMAVILTMAIMAMFVSPNRMNHGLITGALVFVFSDSVIAINKFVTPVPFEGLIIMISYYLAQWLLVTSINRHTKLNVSNS